MPCLALEIPTYPFFVHLAKMGLWGAVLALSHEDVFGLVQGSGVFCLTVGLGSQLGSLGTHVKPLISGTAAVR